MNTRHLGGLAALLLLALAPASAAPNAPKVQVGAPIEITRSHIWCWFPTVHQFRSGEILVSINMCPDEVNSESAFSAYCISTDQGATWSRRYSMGAECLQDGWSDEPDSQDTIWNWGSYPEPAAPGETRRFYAAMTKFSHGGRTIAEERNVMFTLTEPAGMWPTWLFDYRVESKDRETQSVTDTSIKDQLSGRPSGNIIHGDHGDLLCGAYFATASDTQRARAAGTPNSRFRVVLLRSTDEGKSWSEYSVVAKVPDGARPKWMGSEGPNECSIAKLPDHRIYAVYRTSGRDGTIGNSWSSDGGKTWTEPASIGFQGVAPRIHRLHNGMLALVTGRPGPVVLRFNPDGNGEKWSEPITLATERTTAYTDFVEVKPGRLLVVYDSVPYGWYEIPFADRNGRNIIYGKYVDFSE